MGPKPISNAPTSGEPSSLPAAPTRMQTPQAWLALTEQPEAPDEEAAGQAGAAGQGGTSGAVRRRFAVPSQATLAGLHEDRARLRELLDYDVPTHMRATIDDMASNLRPDNRQAFEAMLDQEGVTPHEMHALAATASILDKVRSGAQGSAVAAGFGLGNVANFAAEYAHNPWVRFGLAPGALVAAFAVNYIGMAVPRIGPKFNPLVSAGTARLPNASPASDSSADKALHYDPFHATFTVGYVLTDAVADILEASPQVRLGAKAAVGLAAGAARSLKAFERSNAFRTEAGSTHRQAWLDADNVEATRAAIAELRRGVAKGLVTLVGDGLEDIVRRGLPAIPATVRSPKTWGIAGSLGLSVPAVLLSRAPLVSDRFGPEFAQAGRQVGNGLLIAAYNCRFALEDVAGRIGGTTHQAVLQKAFPPRPRVDQTPT